VQFVEPAALPLPRQSGKKHFHPRFGRFPELREDRSALPGASRHAFDDMRTDGKPRVVVRRHVNDYLHPLHAVIHSQESEPGAGTVRASVRTRTVSACTSSKLPTTSANSFAVVRSVAERLPGKHAAVAQKELSQSDVYRKLSPRGEGTHAQKAASDVEGPTRGSPAARLCATALPARGVCARRSPVK